MIWIYIQADDTDIHMHRWECQQLALAMPGHLTVTMRARDDYPRPQHLHQSTVKSAHKPAQQERSPKVSSTA